MRYHEKVATDVRSQREAGQDTTQSVKHAAFHNLGLFHPVDRDVVFTSLTGSGLTSLPYPQSQETRLHSLASHDHIPAAPLTGFP